MARVAIGVVELAGKVGQANVLLSTTSSDTANNHTFTLKDGDILYAQNADAGVQTVTIVTTADEIGRTITIAQVQAAGETRLYGPFERIGFAQSDETIQIDVTVSNTVRLAVIRDVGNA